MGPIRTLIVDDEPLARAGLRTLLEQEADIELVGECSDGVEAVACIERLRPDVLFLDVQMARLGGFDVLRALKEPARPWVVLVTGHSQYALPAFDVDPVDFLLKPFSNGRFRQALDRVRRCIEKEAQVARLRACMTELLGRLAPPEPARPSAYLRRIPVKERGRVTWLDVDRIEWIEAADNYVNLHSGGRAFLVLPEEAERAAFTIGLQPITEIHLDQTFPTGLEPTSDPKYAYLLSAMAVFVLLIAAINFMTLSIGQSTRRAREVGVRKVMGAPRRQLMQQFWGEAFLLVGLALCVGLGLAQLLLPLFSELAGRALALTYDAGTLLFLAGLLVAVGFGAGSYPAAVLSGFRPIDVLKDRLQLAGDRSFFRRSLVVVQFTLSILMVIGTFFIARQLHYLQTKNLGFDKEQVVVVRTGVDVEQAMPIIERFRAALDGHAAVAGLTASAYALDEGWLTAGYTDPNGTWRTFNVNWGLSNYVETMGMSMAAGRPFTGGFATDSSKIVVNEALVRAFGWASPAAAVGQRLPGTDFPDHEIIGVVKDFNFESLRSEVAPLVLALDPNVVLKGVSDVNTSTSSRRKIAVRLRPTDVPAAMALLERTWKTVAPDLPYDYYFLDQAVDRQYRQEERLGRIVGAASALSVLIACLGLFGLATLSVVRRTKEIGVRKVMGASAASIVLLLSKDFARLVAIAFVLAVPVAYFAVDRWLQDFAYRVDIGRNAGIFAIAGAAALFVALATVSYHALRAATADPVKALRYE